MKKIIYLTDLSEKSINGAYTLYEWAKKTKSTLLFLNSFKLDTNKKDDDHPGLFHNDTEVRNKLYELCLYFKKKNPDLGIDIQYSVREGKITECLNEMFSNQQVDLVSLTTEGTLDKTHPKYGYIISELLKTIPCTVLTIPPNYSFKKVEHITVISDSETNPDNFWYNILKKVNSCNVFVKKLSDVNYSDSSDLLYIQLNGEDKNINQIRDIIMSSKIPALIKINKN